MYWKIKTVTVTLKISNESNFREKRWPWSVLLCFVQNVYIEGNFRYFTVVIGSYPSCSIINYEFGVVILHLYRWLNWCLVAQSTCTVTRKGWSYQKLMDLSRYAVCSALCSQSRSCALGHFAMARTNWISLSAMQYFVSKFELFHCLF